MTKIELVDILPTKQEIVNYGKYISSLNLRSDNEVDYETPYIITDEELTQQKLNEYDKYCQENDIDGDYLLASLITEATFELNKGNGDD
ncbi:hypothetical protein QT738_22370 [Xanthomonas citri pv. citri]